MKDIKAYDRAVAIAKAALEKKAEDVRVLEVGGLTSLADYFIICSGNTDRQVKAIVEEIDRVMRASRELPHHIEGVPQYRWVLMDYTDVVVHVFDNVTREYYNLEGLWADAPAVEL